MHWEVEGDFSLFLDELRAKSRFLLRKMTGTSSFPGCLTASRAICPNSCSVIFLQKRLIKRPSSIKCLHNILRHLFCTDVRKLQEYLRNIYEKLRSFIRSGLCGCILTDHKGVIDLILNRHDYPDFAS